MDYASSAWFAVAEKETYPVAIKIKPPLACSIKETLWHPTQRITDNPDGSVTLRAEVPSLEEVARWVLASALHAEVLEPAELKEIVHKWVLAFV